MSFKNPDKLKKAKNKVKRITIAPKISSDGNIEEKSILISTVNSKVVSKITTKVRSKVKSKVKTKAKPKVKSK